MGRGDVVAVKRAKNTDGDGKQARNREREWRRVARRRPLIVVF